MRGDATSTRRRLLGGAAAVAVAGTAAGFWAERSGEAARVWHHFAGGACAGPDGGHDACLWRLIAPQQVAFAVACLQA